MSNPKPDQETPAPVDPLAQADPVFVTAFDALYTDVWSSGAIPAKYKELAGVALSVALRCESCVAYHLKMGLNEQATREELIEAIRLGLLTGGSITIPTARYAYTVLQNLNVLS